MVLGRVLEVVTGTGGEGRVRLPSTEAEEPQPYEEESASSSIGEDEEEESTSSLEDGDDAESVKRVPSTTATATSIQPQPKNASTTETDEDDNLNNPSTSSTPLALLHLFTHSTTTLSRSIDRLVHKRTRQQLKQLSSPSSNSTIDIVLGARDLLKLGLGVGSDGGDARLLEQLANNPSSRGSGEEGIGKKSGKKGKKKKGRNGVLVVVGGKGDGDRMMVRVKVEVGRWWSWVPGLA